MNVDIKLGDCMEEMKKIPTGGINLIICDPPYNVTNNYWDNQPISLQLLWEHYRRIAASNAAIILFGQGIFSARLMISNEEWYKYSLVWQKTTVTGFLNASRQPLRNHEDILVFYQSQCIYNPIKTYGHQLKVSTAEHKRDSKNSTNYRPSRDSTYESRSRYPKSVLTFKSDKQKSAIAPTQKPVALIEYLIRTYSNPGDLILDNMAGSGTTGIAAMNSGRNAILIENDEGMFSKAKRRLREHYIKLNFRTK